MRFTIPLIQRIALFSCKSPTDAIKLHLVHPLFSETMIEYKTIQLVFANIISNAQQKEKTTTLETVKSTFFNLTMQVCGGEKSSFNSLSWLVKELLEHPKTHFVFLLQGVVIEGRFALLRGKAPALSSQSHGAPLFALEVALMANNTEAAGYILDFGIEKLKSPPPESSSTEDRQLAQTIKNQIEGNPWTGYERLAAFAVSHLYCGEMNVKTAKFLHEKLRQLDPEISKNHLLGRFGTKQHKPLVVRVPLEQAVNDKRPVFCEWLLQEAKNCNIFEEMFLYGKSLHDSMKVTTDRSSVRNVFNSAVEVACGLSRAAGQSPPPASVEVVSKILEAAKLHGRELLRYCLILSRPDNESNTSVGTALWKCNDADRQIQLVKTIFDFAEQNDLLDETFSVMKTGRRSAMFLIASVSSAEVFDYVFQKFEKFVTRRSKSSMKEHLLPLSFDEKEFDEASSPLLESAKRAPFEVFSRLIQVIRKYDDRNGETSLMKTLLFARDDEDMTVFLEALYRCDYEIGKLIIDCARECDVEISGNGNKSNHDDEKKSIVYRIITDQDAGRKSPITILAGGVTNKVPGARMKLLKLIVASFKSKSSYHEELRAAEKSGESVLNTARRMKNHDIADFFMQNDDYEMSVEAVKNNFEE